MAGSFRAFTCHLEPLNMDSVDSKAENDAECIVVKPAAGAKKLDQVTFLLFVFYCIWYSVEESNLVPSFQR